MHIAIVGAGGRLGNALCSTLLSTGHQVSALRRADLDVRCSDQVRSVISRVRPDAIINCSAYNAVDAAEADPPTAFAVNAVGPALLADAAEGSGAILVHYSTDFVFDGEARAPYTELAPTNPLSVYGASKAAGEVEVRRATRHYILRLASLFGGSCASSQRATIDWIASNLLAGLTVRVLVDRTVSPSYVPDVTRATLELLDGQAPFGTYHCVNSGCSTWYELALELTRMLGADDRIETMLSRDLNTPAARPRFCALSNDKLRSIGIQMPAWQSAVRRHVVATYGVRPRAQAIA